MKQKTIIYVIFSLGNGGTQRMLVNILNEIDIPDFQKTVFLYNDTAKDSIDYDLDTSIKIIKYSGKHKFKFIIRLKYLYNIIKSNKPSKIFCFSIQGAYLAIIIKYFCRLKFEIIYRMVSVDSALIESKNSLIKKIKSYFYYNILCKKVSLIIAQTNFMANSLIKRAKYLNNKIVVINNIIDCKTIDSKSKEYIDIKKPYIVFVGQLSAEKNIPGIIEAFYKIKDKIKENLVIVGSGYQQVLLNDIIRRYKLDNRVFLVGHKKNPYKYIANANLIVLFSNYEGFPNVIIEGMFCKTPVISSDFEGADEIIKNYNNGYLVSKKNIEMLAQKITEVLNQDNQEIIANSLRYIEELNARSKKLYKKLLNG